MIKIGDFNTLRVTRFVDFGAYLSDPDSASNTEHSEEVLLPRRYVDDSMQVGDEIKVFVYTDSEDRPVATTETPFIRVGEFAYLQVQQVNRVGAFMDWGLQKNLLVPFKEQKLKMFPGGIYLVYAYLDNNTGRVVGSARIEKFLGNTFPDFKAGDEVQALVIGKTDIGYQTIVNNLFYGMIYLNEVYNRVEIGETVRAYVKNVRDDNKIDLTLTSPGTLNRIELIADKILSRLAEEGSLTVTDKSSPQEIASAFQCSKKDFKKAIGLLYRNRKIVIDTAQTIFPAENC